MARTKSKPFTYDYNVRFGDNPDYINFNDIPEDSLAWVKEQLLRQFARSLGYEADQPERPMPEELAALIEERKRLRETKLNEAEQSKDCKNSTTKV